MELFAKVKDVLTISGRGLVVTVEFISQTSRVRAGDRIRLQNPDGRILETTIGGIEIACGPRVHCQNALLLGPEISKDNVEMGAEIWRLSEEQAPNARPTSD